MRKGRGRNFDQVKDVVELRVKATSGRISAKRLLPQARAAAYAGSARNFRRLAVDNRDPRFALTNVIRATT